MNGADFKNWLDGFLNFERLPQKNIFWLDTMEFLCAQFAHPENSAPCVHVAGSKGKGSVARMVSSILSESGKKVGLYTSPHITDFYERASLNGEFFSSALYSDSADEMKEKIDALKNGGLPGGRPLTWFELTTLFAFLCFKNARTNANVFEVGLGGRLDATNVVRPKIAVINTIELEHTEYLGTALERIAAEKAGIIKERTPVLCAAAPKSVRAVFEKAAKQKSAPLYMADELLDGLEFSYETEARFGKNAELPQDKDAGGGQKASQGQDALKCQKAFQDQNAGGSFSMNVKISSRLFSRPLRARMRLLGAVQAQNAFLAAAAVRLAFPEIPEETIERGLEKAALPARFQTIALGERGLLVLDGAHTANSIRGTMETFRAIFGDDARKKRLLFACAADKDADAIAPLFKEADGGLVFEKVTVTKLNSAKKSDPQKAAAAFARAGISAALREDYENAIKGEIEAAENDGAILLAAGSFYLAAEILSGGRLR